MKVYPLMKYNPDPKENPQSFAEKQNLAPYIAVLADTIETDHSKRPTGEVVSRATGAFVGDHMLQTNCWGDGKRIGGFVRGVSYGLTSEEKLGL